MNPQTDPRGVGSTASPRNRAAMRAAAIGFSFIIAVAVVVAVITGRDTHSTSPDPGVSAEGGILAARGTKQPPPIPPPTTPALGTEPSTATEGAPQPPAATDHPIPISEGPVNPSSPVDPSAPVDRSAPVDPSASATPSGAADERVPVPSGSKVLNFTAMADLKGRNGPSLDAKVLQPIAYPIGSKVPVVCQVTGGEAFGSTAWDLTADGFYVTDAYVDTGDPQTAPKIPACPAR